MRRFGYSLGDGIHIGFIIGVLGSELDSIVHRIHEFGFRHNMIENINMLAGEELSKWEEEDAKRSLLNIEYIEKDIDKYNETINIFNSKHLERMSFYQNTPHLKEIDKTDLINYLKERFLRDYKNKEAQELANQVLDLKIKTIVNESRTSILEFREFFFNLLDDSEKNITKKYARGFTEAKIILSAGCSETAVFVVGRTIESLINDLLENEIKNSRIKVMDLKKTRLEDKIGKLKSMLVINEKEFHILQRLKFDRNDFGHPFDKEISFNEAKRIISESLDLAINLEKKLK